MKNRNFRKISLSLITIFIWIGFVSSISFMEAWLKFRAPNVTLSIGLGIGQLIFAALNRVEWFFLIVLVTCTLLSEKGFKLSRSFFLFLPLAILIIQTFLLLPALNERAYAISRGIALPRSFVHFYYLFLEVIKVSSLFLLGLVRLRELREVSLNLS